VVAAVEGPRLVWGVVVGRSIALERLDRVRWIARKCVRARERALLCSLLLLLLAARGTACAEANGGSMGGATDDDDDDARKIVSVK